MAEIRAHLPASYNLSLADIQAKATAGTLDVGRLYQTADAPMRFFVAKTTATLQEVFVGGDKSEVYEQSPASATWTINHSLNKRPSVTVVDSAGTAVEGEVQYISNSQIILKFNAAFSGKAYLN